MTFGQLMQFVRLHFPSDPARNGSVLKALIRKWGFEETRVMVEGAKQLGWTNLLALNASEGVGRRMATAKYWMTQNAERPRERLESLGSALKARGLV